jgi:glutamyl-tRNA synthetase
MPPPRLRFAPSPTGYLHVGGARTALFNWLYARRHGGVFVLRIEDTDVTRSSDEMVGGILEGLRWLGIDWDEGPEVGGPHGPYFQSERLDRYQAAADALVSSGRASHDDGAVRFNVPAGRTAFTDAVKGPIAFDNGHIEPFVILRSDGHPTYHLSVVVDDIDMRITHVVRGDDHVSNTPKQLLLYDAFGAPPPVFAHVPLIMGPDRKRLSKRHGATSVTEYRTAGYVPDAMVNFLALLGWSPGKGDRELFTREELIQAFTLDGISGGSAVFNIDKLNWFNHQYLQALDDEALGAAIAAFDPRAREALGGPGSARGARLLALLRPRAKTLREFVDQLAPFLVDPSDYDPAGVARHLSAPDLVAHLEAWRDACATVEPFDEATLEQTLRALADARGAKAGALIHGTRIAMTGRMVSPGLFEMLVVLGRGVVVARLNALLAFLRQRV